MEVEVTCWAFYQHMVAAYREPDRVKGEAMMQTLITKLGRAVPTKLTELAARGRALKRRAQDILAYFDRLGTSNGPTEAINGRLEHLRGSALDSETRPTTSPDLCWNLADSGYVYTLDREEPH